MSVFFPTLHHFLFISFLKRYFIPLLDVQVEILESFVSNATQVRQESMVKYVNWMVAYEFPALSALAIRLDGVGKKVHDEELSLYIRRKDVLNVVKELELKSLENMVITMRKRLLKHFKSDMDAVSLVNNIFVLVNNNVCEQPEYNI